MISYALIIAEHYMKVHDYRKDSYHLTFSLKTSRIIEEYMDLPYNTIILLSMIERDFYGIF